MVPDHRFSNSLPLTGFGHWTQRCTHRSPSVPAWCWSSSPSAPGVGVGLHRLVPEPCLTELVHEEVVSAVGNVSFSFISLELHLWLPIGPIEAHLARSLWDVLLVNLGLMNLDVNHHKDWGSCVGNQSQSRDSQRLVGLLRNPQGRIICRAYKN